MVKLLSQLKPIINQIMNEKLDRRNFIQKSALSGCALLAIANLNPLLAINNIALNDELIDAKKLNYCGYSCPADCQFLKATKANDPVLKKEAYEVWHLKERYNVDFDADKVFCWGCKVEEEKIGAVAGNCGVRKCAIEKEHDACIQCDDLKNCDKDLWQRFPDFHKAIIDMQVKFKNQS